MHLLQRAPIVLVVLTSLALLALRAPTRASAQSVGSQVDLAHSCSTTTPSHWELRAQLAAAESCWYPSALVPIVPQPAMSISSGSLPYAAPETRDAIYAASRAHSFNVNSAFRTLLEQYYLYTATASACMRVATPGSSNHESGTAVDVSPDGTNASLRSALEGAGCRWFGSGDRVHFDCPPAGATRRTTITLQRLWNLNHPEDPIAEDGVYGPMTRARLRASPIHGFPITPCSEPPPCDDTAGPFTFSCDGPNTDAVCVSIDEPGDPHGWADNYLCSAADVGFVFSTDGAIDGMRCAHLHESADMHADAWADNYACVPDDSPIELAWSSAGPMAGWDCVRWNEPSDPGTWTDNYLCSRPVYCFTNGGFTFCSNGAPSEGSCVAVDEPSDPDTWDNDFFCSENDIGMVWSDEGPIAGMTCTNVDELDDSEGAAWEDNYLCLPADAEVAFVWSPAGPVDGMTCVRWYEAADLMDGWDDNYLCVSPAERPADAGASAADASAADAGTGARVISSGCACRVGVAHSRTAWASVLPFLIGATLVARRRRRGVGEAPLNRAA